MKDVKTRALVALLPAVLLAVSMQASNASKAFAELCVPTIVGLDPSTADRSANVDFGRAKGQTFLARDTLIQSITVWRAALSANVGETPTP